MKLLLGPILKYLWVLNNYRVNECLKNKNSRVKVSPVDPDFDLRSRIMVTLKWTDVMSLSTVFPWFPMATDMCELSVKTGFLGVRILLY